MLINKNIIGKSPYILPHAPSYRHKLDVLTNQFGICPQVVAAIAEASTRDIHMYPGPSAIYRSLLARIATYCGCDIGNIILTNGSDNALKLICETYITPEARVLVPTPTYPHFHLFVSTMYSAGEINISIERDYTAGEVADKVARALHNIPCNLVYLCSPNLPLGYTLGGSEIEPLLQKFPHTMFIVDEAYYEFADAAPVTVAPLLTYKNLIITRTFSKLFGLASLRLGYLLTHPDNIAAMSVLVNEKNVTAIAVAAADASLANLGFYLNQLCTVRAIKSWLCEELRAVTGATEPGCAVATAGCAVATAGGAVATAGGAVATAGHTPRPQIYDFAVAAGNWFLIFCKDPAGVVNTFADHGIFIRNKTDDVAGAVRIALGPREQMEDVLSVCRLINLCWLICEHTLVVDLDNTLRPYSKNNVSLFGDARCLLERREVIVCTNNATYTPAQLSEYFRAHGLSIPVVRIINNLSYARRKFAKEGYKNVFVVGNDNAKAYLGKYSATQPADAAFIACEYFLSQKDMVTICKAGASGAPIYIPDRSTTTTLSDCADIAESGNVRLPDVGAYGEMLEKCGYSIRLLGKPVAEMLDGFGPFSAVVGDSPAADGELAANLGCPFIHLDRTASAPRYDFNKKKFILPSLSYLVSAVRSSRAAVIDDHCRI